MAVGSITLHQLLRHPFVVKVISRISATATPLQSFYGVGMDAPADTVVPAGIRNFVYDIYDHTRQVASIRAPESGPKKVRKQRVGVGHGYLLRSYEAVPFTYESIANLRPLGSPLGTLDRNGQSYVARQIAFATERYRNLREWCLSRMFRGSFTITLSGDDHYVSDSGGQITVDFKLPTEHKNQLAVGTGGADIIDSPWDDTSTDVITQLLNLNKAAQRRSGMPIEHIWVNSTTLGYLLNNVSLQSAGGASYRVWDSMEWREDPSVAGGRLRTGLDVMFRALPWVRFHAFDGVLAPGNAEVDKIPASASDVDLVIPDNVAIMTPNPGPWIGWATGSEVIQRTLASAPETVSGFFSWQRPTLDPFGRELCLIDNFFPIPYIPTAWYYATVSGF